MNWKDASNLYWTGNRLSSIEIDGLDEALAFSYNADGVRNGKTYWDKNGIPTYHRYTVDGNRIISETVSGADNYTLYYLYGANGGIEGFIYNNTYYYFQKNIQGDIIRICNCLGETVVEYGYDVWGTVKSVTGDLASTIGQINPFRYRGYYYDTETGWYYLNARYYDPNVGRFLSPDTILGANGGLQGYNLFAYCNNNPVMFADSSGMCIYGTFSDFQFICNDFSADGHCLKCGQQWSNAYIKSLFDSKGLPDYVDPILKNRYWALNSCKIQQQTAKLRAKARAATEPIQKAYAEEMSTVLCFVAGTAVKAEEGDRAIEEIKVGDRVWSYSPETGETALKQVTRTFVNETDRLVRLIVNGEEILTTPEHPFYVPHSVDERASDWGLGSGWLRAADLRAGDVLYLLDGSSAIVESVEQILLDVPVTVYNFEVEHFHSYFVSPSGLLVHNTCPDENQKIIQKWGKDYKKTGISENDAMALWELAVEYNVPGHAPGYDSYKYGYHMKIYNYHINIIS